eukprot:689707-Hanusia_phi.AAC.1
MIQEVLNDLTSEIILNDERNKKEVQQLREVLASATNTLDELSLGDGDENNGAGAGDDDDADYADGETAREDDDESMIYLYAQRETFCRRS